MHGINFNRNLIYAYIIEMSRLIVIVAIRKIFPYGLYDVVNLAIWIDKWRWLWLSRRMSDWFVDQPIHRLNSVLIVTSIYHVKKQLAACSCSLACVLQPLGGKMLSFAKESPTLVANRAGMRANVFAVG